MAFGTGTHPTTQLCLEYIEELLFPEKVSETHSEKHPGRYPKGETQYPDKGRQELDVLDIGCGSGILSVAAIKLGARHALGVDVDPLAVKVSRENAIINQVSGYVEFGVGSLENILNGEFSIKTAPIVLANILAPVIIKLLGSGLGETLTAHGSLILSGIIDIQEEEVAGTIRRNRLKVRSRKQIDDWVALQVERDG